MKRLQIIFWILLLIFSSSSNGNDITENKPVRREIRFISVPKTITSPRIDGYLNDECWRNSIQLSNFVLTAGAVGRSAMQQTECFFLYDDTHLFVAFKSHEPELEGLKVTSKIWDDLDILYDDRVEVFLDVNHDHRSYFELAVNPKGVQFDQKGFNRLHGSKTSDMDQKWNGFWRAKTNIGKSEWTAEIAIDVTSLGIDQIDEGMTWGFNATRVRQPDVEKGDEFFKRKPAGPAEYSAYVPVKDYIRETISNFHAPIEFGDMVFGDPGFKVKELSFKSALYAFGPVGYPSLFGRNPLEIKVETKDGRSVPAILRITVEPASVERWEQDLKVTLGSDKPIETLYYIPENQENEITIQLLDPDTKQQLYKTSYIEIAPPFIEFNLEPLYTRNPGELNPVSFRLLTDDGTRSETSLELKFCDMESDEILATEVWNDLTGSNQFLPIFDIKNLRALPGGNYYIDCKLYQKNDHKLLANFQQNLTKFKKDVPTDFQAIEGQYSYGGITDYAIRILYPFPAEFVFWRKASYIPWWDIEQAAMTNEFVEIWGAGNQGCSEPMQDRECRYSRVKLVENSPARVRVHWRYALSDPHYRIYRNEWVDEDYILYPDGVGIREVNLWPNSDTRHEMFEALLAKPPGVHTEQLFDNTFASLSNLEGEGYSNKYFYENKDLYEEFLNKSNDFIVEIHFKDRMHPFTVFSLRDDIMPGVTRGHISVCSRIISTADRRGHWPASRYQIDGYNTVGLDVPHHGNIGNIQAEVDPKNQPTTWTFLIGVTDKGSNKPVLHAKSWLYPADIELLSRHFSYDGFDFSQRAYMIKAEKSSEVCKIKLKSLNGFTTNPVFIIDNPSMTLRQIKIDDKKLDDTLFKEGTTWDNKSVIFLNTKIQNNQSITFSFQIMK